MNAKTYRCLRPGTPNEGRRVLLAYPRTGADAAGFSLLAPLSLLHLAARLEDFSVAVFDERVDPPDLYDRLLAEGPLCVGLSSMTGPQIGYALGLAGRARDRGVPAVLGGVHPTLLPDQTAADPRVAAVVTGDGEETFRDLCLELAAGRPVAGVHAGREPDLDRLDILAAYGHVDTEAYIRNHILEGRSLPYQFSRGCPFGCAFCCNAAISGRRWRRGAVSHAVAQTRALAERYDLDAVWFMDENLTTERDTVHALADGIGGRFRWFIQARAASLLKVDLARLERGGLSGVGSGLESGSDAMLAAMGKNARVADYEAANRALAATGVRVWYNYMMGFPGESESDIAATVALALRMLDENPRALNNTFYVLTPYPGTRFGDELFRDHLPLSFEAWREFGRHHIDAPWHTPERVRLFRRITFSSKFTGRKLVRNFPGHAGLASLAARLTAKWRAFDFADDAEWAAFEAEGARVLKDLFGANAY